MASLTDPPTFTSSYERFRPAFRAALSAYVVEGLTDKMLDELGDAIGDIAAATFYDEGGQRHPGGPPVAKHSAPGEWRGVPLTHPDPSALHERIRAENPGSTEAHNLIRAISALLAHYGYPSTGLTLDLIQRLLVEHRQYREAHSHAQQLRDHYREALVAVVEGMRNDPIHDGLLHVPDHYREAARQALDNLPEWDGRLRA